ncbi:MAG TPA: CRISPR-associated protein Csx15 [Caldilineaceae bacterium]|nr:CRISPR-associated protein Csx15 [Caldilineaceae bacterium]
MPTPVILINFSHPLDDEQLHRLEAELKAPIGRVIERPANFDDQAAFAPQVAALADQVGLSSQEWQQFRLVIGLPSLNVIAGVLLAELHGRMGYFPAILRVRPVAGSTPRRFEVAEVIDLQAVRDAARRSR